MDVTGDGADLSLSDLRLLGGGVVHPAVDGRPGAPLHLEGHAGVVVALGLQHRIAVVVGAHGFALDGHGGKDVAVAHEVPHADGAHLVGLSVDGDLRLGDPGLEGVKPDPRQDRHADHNENGAALFHIRSSS